MGLEGLIFFPLNQVKLDTISVRHKPNPFVLF